MKILITTSGTGSRLGNYTTYTNKSLLRVGDKPVISHIIESYSDSDEFIVTLGYKGNLVKEFLNFAYPNKKIHFLTIDKYAGNGSSLLYSISKCEKYLQCEFVYHACDSIIDKINLEEIDSDTIFVNKSTNSGIYRQIKIDENVKILKASSNSINTFDYVGVAVIKSYKEFWKNVKKILSKSESSSNSDIDALEGLRLSALYTSVWYDTGTISGYLDTCRKFNSSHTILHKFTEDIYFVGKNVIKFFASEERLRDRVERINKTYLSDIAPPVVGIGTNMTSYRKIPGEVFSKTILPEKIEHFIDWCEEHIWSAYSEDINNFEETCFNFYITKTINRANMYLDNLADVPTIINGIHIPAFHTIITELTKNPHLYIGTPGGYHGDLVLDNIIDSEGMYSVIDWRENFGGDSIHVGDVYYDLAKFSHSLIMIHDVLHAHKFNVRHINDEIKIDFLVNTNLQKCMVEFERVLNLKKYNVNKVKVLMALVWINMSPLHGKEIGKFLFLFGKYKLWTYIKGIKNE